MQRLGYLVLATSVIVGTPAASGCGKPPPAKVVYRPPPPPPPPPQGPPPRFRWGTRPPETGDLFVALEGNCPSPNIGPAKHAMLLTYGIEGKSGPAKVTTVARFTREGLEDLTNGLPAVTAIDRIAGSYPSSLFLQEWGGGKGNIPSDRIWRWRTGPDGRPGWELAMTPEPEHGFRIPVRWAGGYIAVEELADPTSGVVNLSLKGFDLPDKVVAPDLIPPDYNLADLVGFDTGELFALGSRPSDQGEMIWSIRWVAPPDRTPTFHTFGPAPGKAELFAPSPDNIHVKVGGQFYEFDGGSWAPVPPLATSVAWSPVLPEPGAKLAVQGHEAWALSKGELLHWKGNAWAKVDVPSPLFSSSGKFKLLDLAISPDGEAFVTASYTERGPSWNDSIEFHAVLRSHRPFQTMRCNDIDPEASPASNAGRGVQSWPPVADDSCPTPFVVLARRSNAHPQAPDYGPLRAPLRGHTDLEPITIMDVPSGDHTYIGTPVKDIATGKKLLQLESKLSLHGEIVCAEPTPSRTMGIDLRTGGIIKETRSKR